MNFVIADLAHNEAIAFADGPRLVADIGGTHARFALQFADRRIGAVKVLKCGDYAGFADAVAAYLQSLPRYAIRHASIAIANPVQGDLIAMTNHHWRFSIEAVRRQLGFDTLLAVNDFTALALSLPALSATDYSQVGGGMKKSGAIGLVGAGTGLGVGGLVQTGERWTALQSEGGHATFSPVDELEVEILRYCWSIHPHLSAERLVSGPGIELLHEALAVINGGTVGERLTTRDIIQRTIDGDDSACMQTVDRFCGMLGTVAGNVALTLGAAGGMYIGGGVVPRLGEFFARSSFRSRFETKGRFSGYLADIPTYVITAPCPALVGAAVALADHLPS